ncbi:MAG: hypothetical protein ACYTG7_01575 [Planctomycetota bacterium]
MNIHTFLIPCLVALAMALAVGGCNTDYHFQYTPHLDPDFAEPADEMSSQWFDIERYKEHTFPFTSFFEMPTLNELKYGNYFLAPVERGWSWWNLCPFFVIPIPFCPCERMVWERGNYRFEAVVTYPMFLGFNAHVWYWEITEIERGLSG